MGKKKFLRWFMFAYQFFLVTLAVGWGIYAWLNNNPMDDVLVSILLPIGVLGFLFMPLIYRQIDQ